MISSLVVDTKPRPPTFTDLLHRKPCAVPVLPFNGPGSVAVGDVVSFVATATNGEDERVLGVVIDNDCKRHGYDLAAYSPRTTHPTQPLYWPGGDYHTRLKIHSRGDQVMLAVNWEQAAVMFRLAKLAFNTELTTVWYNPFTSKPPAGVTAVQQLHFAIERFNHYFEAEFPKRLEWVLLEFLFLIDANQWPYNQVASLLAPRFKLDPKMVDLWIYDWTDSVYNEST